MKKMLKSLPLALVLCFMVGCQDKAAIAELEEFKAQAALEEQNKELVRHYFEELDNGNIENVMDFFASNLLWYEPSNSPTPWSKEEAHGQLKMLYEISPKWQRKIEEIIAAGDKVITRTIENATHDKEFRGIPATGKKVEFGAIIIFSIDNGKIVEMREELDMLGAMMQLGFELKLKEEK